MPGILAGVAALITAVAALLGALAGFGAFSGDGGPAPTAAQSEATPTLDPSAEDATDEVPGGQAVAESPAGAQQESAEPPAPAPATEPTQSVEEAVRLDKEADAAAVEAESGTAAAEPTQSAEEAVRLGKEADAAAVEAESESAAARAAARDATEYATRAETAALDAPQAAAPETAAYAVARWAVQTREHAEEARTHATSARELALKSEGLASDAQSKLNTIDSDTANAATRESADRASRLSSAALERAAEAKGAASAASKDAADAERRAERAVRVANRATTECRDAECLFDRGQLREARGDHLGALEHYLAVEACEGVVDEARTQCLGPDSADENRETVTDAEMRLVALIRTAKFRSAVILSRIPEVSYLLGPIEAMRRLLERVPKLPWKDQPPDMAEAEEALLALFDYVWNKEGNGLSAVNTQLVNEEIVLAPEDRNAIMRLDPGELLILLRRSESHDQWVEAMVRDEISGVSFVRAGWVNLRLQDPSALPLFGSQEINETILATVPYTPTP